MNPLHLSSNFKGCNETTNDDIIHIKDNEPCEITDSSDYHLICLNPKQEDILFVKVDDCVYKSGDGEKCDCMLSNGIKTYLVEIKELQITQNAKKRHRKRKKARNQLAETIIKLKRDIVDPIDLSKVFGVICLVPTMEINYTKPINIMHLNAVDDFITKCGCPNLLEGNVIRF